MRKLTTVLAIICLMVGLMILSIACGSDDETGGSGATNPGELPTLHKGDQWEYRAIDEDTEYHLTLTVTDVGKFYTMKMEMDPPLMGTIDETTAQFDKKLLLPVSMEFTGEDKETGMAFSLETEASYELSGDRWPLVVGKEIEVTETSTDSMDIAGEDMTDTTTTVSTYKVEAVETITVEAGTFECYRIAKYDEFGEKELTSWHSDKVKSNVKQVDHEMNEVQELIDYSVK